VRLREAATERAVRAADLSNQQIIAFATHGLLAGELEGVAEPGLVFTPPATPSEADDGLLTASEITTLKLNADWVILSACNTAAGDGTGAPGLSGLARAFFYAGAKTLLASHWPVRDDVAAEITVDAITRQRATPRISRAQALQAATIAIRNSPDDPTRAHPAAWAPFSLIGDGGK
jgi:CHAT domain-containing protein